MWDAGPRDARGRPFSNDDLSACIAEAATATPALVTVRPGTSGDVGERFLYPDREDPQQDVETIITTAAALGPGAGTTAASHLLDTASVRAYVDGDITRFVGQRTEAVNRAIDAFLSAMIEPGASDVGPLRLDELDREAS